MDRFSSDEAQVATAVAAVLYLATRYAVQPSPATAAAIEQHLRLIADSGSLGMDPGVRELLGRLVAEWRALTGCMADHGGAPPAGGLH